jgi:hypothetical protein
MYEQLLDHLAAACSINCCCCCTNSSSISKNKWFSNSLSIIIKFTPRSPHYLTNYEYMLAGPAASQQWLSELSPCTLPNPQVVFIVSKPVKCECCIVLKVVMLGLQEQEQWQQPSILHNPSLGGMAKGVKKM